VARYALISSFNLLVSTGRGLEDRCISSLRGMLSKADIELEASRSPFSGLVLGHVEEPRGIVTFVRDLLEEEPWHNDLVKRVVPIDRVVAAGPEDIVRAADELRNAVEPDASQTFRVRVRKRGADLDRMGLVVAVAELFENPVDLEAPDFEVRVEMVRTHAGVSIIRRGEIFPDL
jgi:tRNA(Ser,Leu) C12 N-acetylase TAN1